MSRLMRSMMVVAVFAVVVLAAAPAHAVPLTFDIAYSGASFNNGASASGSIVIESALMPNPGGTSNYAAVLALSLTVSGASAGNGTFTRPDFSFWVWSTGGGTLNLNQELVGQAVPGGAWGTTGGCCGDFNLFRANPAAPTGTLHFRLTTQGGQNMLLTSMRQRVPEPTTLVLLGLGTLGIGYARRKLQA